MDKKAKLPNRQTFVNPAGIGTKSEVFSIFGSDIYLLAETHTTESTLLNKIITK
jgi:hypothetical protein